MINIQLYLTRTSDYDQIELFDFEGIELVQSVQDVRDISKVFAEFTRSFTVPASKNNNKAFKHFYNPDIGRETGPNDNLRFDARKRIDAEIHINYMFFKKGRLQLDAVNMKANKPYSYTVTFFGDTIKLAETIGDKELNELPALGDIEVPYTATNILSLMETAQDVTVGSETITDALLVPLITSTQRLVYDSNDSTKENNLYPHGDVVVDGVTKRFGVDYLDLKPAIRVHTIVKAIEEKYSNIEFSNDFFKISKTNGVYDNRSYAELFMWLHTEAGKVDVDVAQVRLGASDFTTPFGDTGEFGLGSGYPSTGTYQVIPGDADRKMTDYYLSVKITPSNKTEKYNFILKKDNVEFIRTDELVGDTQPMVSGLDSTPETEGRVSLPRGAYSFHIETSAAITFDFQIKLKKNRAAKSPTGLFERRTFVIHYTASKTFSQSDVDDVQKDVATLIPKMKIMDFITGLFKMFNLTATVDKDGKIVVKTLNSFYGAGDTVDITEYVDTTESTIESVVPYSEIEFGYEGLDTIFADQHREIAGKNWGTANYPDIDSDPDNDEFLNIGEKYEVLLPFEHQKYNRLFDGDDPANDITNIQWGYSVNREGNSILGKPLLFYAIQPSQNTIEVTTGTASSTNKTTYYMPSNSINSNTINTANINFFAEINEFTLIEFEDTLFKVYYKDYIKETFDPASRLYKYKAILPDNILRELELSDTVIIFDADFRINKMSTNFLTNVTNIELLRKSNLIDLQDNMADLTDNVSKTLGTVDTTQVTVDLTDRTL